MIWRNPGSEVEMFIVRSGVPIKEGFYVDLRAHPFLSGNDVVEC